jgi:hypothetical protein
MNCGPCLSFLDSQSRFQESKFETAGAAALRPSTVHRLHPLALALHP